MVTTLLEALVRAADTDRGYVFVRDTGTTRTQRYAELLQVVLRIGGSLAAMGLHPGDLVAIVAPDAETFLPAFLGVAAAGLVPAPVFPPSYLGQDASYQEVTGTIVRASRANAILTTASLKPVIGGLDLRGMPPVIYAEELSGPTLPAPIRVDYRQPAIVQFTSGSTSEPKGVVLSHHNLAANVVAIGAALRLNEREVTVSWLPLYHDMGLIGMALVPIYFGMKAVFMSPQMFIKRPVEWLKGIQSHGGTVSFAPNFGYDLVVRRVRDLDLIGLDLSSWRVAGCGSEPIQAETLITFAERFEASGFRASSFVPSYGMAEHALAVTFTPLDRPPVVDVVSGADLTQRQRAVPCGADDPGGARLVSCGVAFPGHEVRIADDHGRPMPERRVGEVLLRGPSVMQGYFDQPELNEETLRGGWLHSGDLGYLANGELYVCGRKKETIIVNGRNYYPQDLEWAVGGIDGIRRGRVVAFGTSAPGRGDSVVVVAETNGESAEPLEPQIRRRILDLFGLYVDDVVVARGGTIAKTTSGKLKRGLARARYEAGEFAERPQLGPKESLAD